MSVVGFDVGNDTLVAAAARQRGMDVLLNAESKRESPAAVAFSHKRAAVAFSHKRETRPKVGSRVRAWASSTSVQTRPVGSFGEGDVQTSTSPKSCLACRPGHGVRDERAHLGLLSTVVVHVTPASPDSGALLRPWAPYERTPSPSGSHIERTPLAQGRAGNSSLFSSFDTAQRCSSAPLTVAGSGLGIWLLSSNPQPLADSGLA